MSAVDDVCKREVSLYVYSDFVFQLVMPSVGNESIFTITSVEKAVIGSNIQGTNSTATPVLKSSHSDGIHDRAVYDLGTGINTNNDTSNSDPNLVVVAFEVLLNCHSNITNNSKYWVGAGLVGRPRMIWVGQIAIYAQVDAASRPRIDMMAKIMDGTGLTVS